MDPILDQGTDQDGLSLGQRARSDLYEAARWGKFLSIVGFILIGLIVIFSLFAMVTMGAAASYGGGMGMGLLGGGITFFVYLFVIALNFFPTLYLYRFSTNAMLALNQESQGDLDYSISNLKSMFKFLGILMIVVLSFYALLILFGLLVGIGSSF